IEALGRLRDERAVTSLLEFVRHYRKGEVATESLLALARIGHAAARDQLRPRLTDADPFLRVAAVEGLGRMGDRDSLGQRHAMVQNDPVPSVRLAAAFGVWHFGEPRLPMLAAAFDGATEIQAREYLLEIGAPADLALRAALAAATTPRLRANLIALIGFVGSQ